VQAQRPWHRLFGLTWIDFFTGQPVTVEMEKDLSLKKQLLDVLVIHKEAENLSCRLPDGFEDLAWYNLVTFKSHAQTLSVWTLHELIGHYVNLRKQVSPGMDEDQLLPEEHFRLYAVSARHPQQLATQLGPALRPLMAGVYEASLLGLRVRVVVANQLAEAEHNALLHLFSTRAELLAYGGRHYHVHSPDASTLLVRLFWGVQEEAGVMSSALEEFARETMDELAKKLPLEKRLELLKDLPVEIRLELLKNLPVEQRLELLQELFGQQALLEGLSREQRSELAKKLLANGPMSEGGR
jgi:hypothetical protein